MLRALECGGERARVADARNYIRSGAVMPSNGEAVRSTICAARARTSRARVIGSGSSSTCAL